jgi:hypothetical protein
MAESVKVIVRCRPMNKREKDLNCKVSYTVCSVYHLKRNPNTVPYSGTKMKSEVGAPPCYRLTPSSTRHSSQGHPCC